MTYVLRLFATRPIDSEDARLRSTDIAIEISFVLCPRACFTYTAVTSSRLVSPAWMAGLLRVVSGFRSFMKHVLVISYTQKYISWGYVLIYIALFSSLICLKLLTSVRWLTAKIAIIRQYLSISSTKTWRQNVRFCLAGRSPGCSSNALLHIRRWRKHRSEARAVSGIQIALVCLPPLN